MPLITRVQLHGFGKDTVLQALLRDPSKIAEAMILMFQDCVKADGFITHDIRSLTA